jgi:hypothetical protein
MDDGDEVLLPVKEGLMSISGRLDIVASDAARGLTILLSSQKEEEPRTGLSL